MPSLPWASESLADAALSADSSKVGWSTETEPFTKGANVKQVFNKALNSREQFNSNLALKKKKTMMTKKMKNNNNFAKASVFRHLEHYSQLQW